MKIYQTLKKLSPSNEESKLKYKQSLWLDKKTKQNKGGNVMNRCIDWVRTQAEECDIVIFEIYTEMEELISEMLYIISGGPDSEDCLCEVMSYYNDLICSKLDKYIQWSSQLEAYYEMLDELLFWQESDN